jgi:hypothetical protein
MLIRVVYFTIGSILKGGEDRDSHSNETVAVNSLTVVSVRVLHLITDKGELLTYRNRQNFDF